MQLKKLKRMLMSLLWRVRLQQLRSSKSLVTLVIILGIFTLYSLYLFCQQSSGVHIRCECGNGILTDERVDRYLQNLLAELDPVTNRSVKELIRTNHPSLAIDFLNQQEVRGGRCATTPGLFSIRHRNVVWQEAEVARTTFLAYGAYYDDRDEELGPLVRILVSVESTWPPIPTCHLWYNNDVIPTATRAIKIEYIHWQERLEGHWLPYIITCTAGNRDKGVPQVVSIVSDPCSPSTNALKIHHQISDPKKSLAICHKFIFNPARDFSVRLVEWIEHLRAWGIDHLTIYEASSHPNVKKVLTFYLNIGFLTIIPWTSPGSQPQLSHLYRILYDTQRYSLFTDENIPYTDCLLRNIHSHRFVGVWDMDEFIFPAIHDSLPKMLDFVSSKASRQGLNISSYLARGTYYFDDQAEEPTKEIPQYFHMLRHITRTVKFLPPKIWTKAIHDTANALGLHAHFALLNLKGEVDRDHNLYHLYPADEAQLAHYRNQCQGESQDVCQEIFRPHLVQDKTVFKHKDTVVQNTKNVLKRLNLITT